MSGHDLPVQERRQNDSQFGALLDLMSTHHRTMVSMLDQNREHMDQKLETLTTRFDEEIPLGHGIYHRKLIEETARRQALRDAMRNRVAAWALGTLLTIVSGYWIGAGKWVSNTWHTFVGFFK